MVDDLFTVLHLLITPYKIISMSEEILEMDLPEDAPKKDEKSKEIPPKVQPVSDAEFNSALEKLFDLGGFDIISTTIEGADNMEPGPMRDMFLMDNDTQVEREALRVRVGHWVKMLESESNIGSMIEKAIETSEKSGELLVVNIKRTLDATKDLEMNYRALSAFFVNAGGDKPVKNLTILNAPMDKVRDMDSRRFIGKVAEEFKEKYDRLDLMNNYSLLVVPGYMGSKEVIDEWGRVAHDHKVMLLTDFANLENTDQVLKQFERMKLTGDDEFRANMMMCCNWLVGREQYLDAGEQEPLFIPPSAALAGKLYSENMAQVAAGVRHGVMRGALGTRFVILANDLAKLGDMGLIPMENSFNQVQAMSSSSLFTGTNPGMKTYSVTRTFDWLTKCMMDFLNRKVFINISVQEEMTIHKEVSRFFDQCVREYKFLEKVGKVDVKRDPNYRDRLHIYVHATPFFPARNFVLRLDGKSGESPGEANKYDAKVE